MLVFVVMIMWLQCSLFSLFLIFRVCCRRLNFLFLYIIFLVRLQQLRGLLWRLKIVCVCIFWVLVMELFVEFFFVIKMVVVLCCFFLVFWLLLEKWRWQLCSFLLCRLAFLVCWLASFLILVIFLCFCFDCLMCFFSVLMVFGLWWRKLFSFFFMKLIMKVCMVGFFGFILFEFSLVLVCDLKIGFFIWILIVVMMEVRIFWWLQFLLKCF